jgi:hypothetical protein
VAICWPTQSSAKSWDNLEPSAGGEGLSRSANSARRRHDGVMGKNDILPGSIILGEIEDGRGIERLAYHQVGSSSTYQSRRQLTKVRILCKVIVVVLLRTYTAELRNR